MENFNKEMLERAKLNTPIGNHKPYQGNVYDIDMSKEWFCPHCEDVPRLTVVSYDELGLGLVCPTRWEECDYSFNNEPMRENCNEVWYERFRYPLTFKERIKKLILIKSDSVKRLKSERSRLLKCLKRLNIELDELEKIKSDL